MQVTPTRKDVLELIANEPTAVVAGLLKARKTGRLVINSTRLGSVELDVVTLRNVNGKVTELPVEISMPRAIISKPVK